MIIRFQEIYDEVLNAMRLNESTVEAAQLTSIKLRINQIQDYIFFMRDWEWRRKSFFFTTKPKYTTGTISVTQGSAVITGSGTAWLDIMREGYLKVNGVVYKISSVASNTSARLAQAYAGATASGLAYEIVYPEYNLDPNISGIINVSIQGRDLAVKNAERTILNLNDSGEPDEFALAGRSKETFYSTGSVAMTNASKTVVGTGTSWDSTMEGKVFRVDEFAENFIIETVNTATSITLRSNYTGSTGSGKTYKIDPEGLQVGSFRGVPDDYYPVTIDALITPRRLVSADDISLVPNHAPLLHGAIWLALTDYDNKNPVRIQQARADFDRTLKQLESSYRIATNVKWRSNQEASIRSQGGLNRFNPLAD